MAANYGRDAGHQDRPQRALLLAPLTIVACALTNQDHKGMAGHGDSSSAGQDGNGVASSARVLSRLGHALVFCQPTTRAPSAPG